MFQLAVQHVNQEGGAFGLPAPVAVGDVMADPEKAITAARQLIEVESGHAIVGPSARASPVPVADGVGGPAAIATISLSATSPELTALADNDLLFRAELSDVSQGPVPDEAARHLALPRQGLLAKRTGFREPASPACRSGATVTLHVLTGLLGGGLPDVRYHEGGSQGPSPPCA